VTYRVVDLTNALARIGKARDAPKRFDAGLAHVDRKARLCR
jgi:hypothetical protein